jgi:hypothetical protein
MPYTMLMRPNMAKRNIYFERGNCGKYAPYAPSAAEPRRSRAKKK